MREPHLRHPWVGSERRQPRGAGAWDGGRVSTVREETTKRHRHVPVWAEQTMTDAERTRPGPCRGHTELSPFWRLAAVQPETTQERGALPRIDEMTLDNLMKSARFPLRHWIAFHVGASVVCDEPWTHCLFLPGNVLGEKDEPERFPYEPQLCCELPCRPVAPGCGGQDAQRPREEL